jgi:hypothetical protein
MARLIRPPLALTEGSKQLVVQSQEDIAFTMFLGSTMLAKDYVYCRKHETRDRVQNHNHFRGIEGARLG